MEIHFCKPLVRVKCVRNKKICGVIYMRISGQPMAHNTLREMALAGLSNGHEYFAEHSRRPAFVHGLNALRLARQCDEIEQLNYAAGASDRAPAAVRTLDVDMPSIIREIGNRGCFLKLNTHPSGWIY